MINHIHYIWHKIRWYWPYKIFSAIKKHWVAMNRPFEYFAITIRHKIMGKIWPAGAVVRADYINNVPAVILQKINSNVNLDVAIVIPCHNYAHYLPKAIESILKQSHHPTEILVVDDDSNDNTKNVALRYSEHGVKYLYCSHHNLALTRNEGANNTISPFLIFLDADDILPRHYIKRCLKEMNDPSVAIVYGNMKHFGEKNFNMITAKFTMDHLERTNYISSHAMIRRTAFDMVGGYRKIPDSIAEDWDIYRRITRLNWKAKKAKTYVKYRVHNKSMTNTYKKRLYMNDASLDIQPLTIVTRFTYENLFFKKYLFALNNINCNRLSTSIHWINENKNNTFTNILKSQIIKLPFKQVTYTDLVSHTKYNKSTSFQISLITMLQTCNTELILLLGENTICKPNILNQMYKFMDSIVVAVTAFSKDNINCCLLRKSALKNIPPSYNEKMIFKFLRLQGKVISISDCMKNKTESSAFRCGITKKQKVTSF